jgi:thiosulfate/3-mercaptopyruvate sulfurtransferase
MSDQGYAAPELLVETEWLAQHLADPSVRVVDMDQPPGYQKGHIPGAVGVPDQRLKSVDSPLHVLEPEAAQALVESLTIADDTLVVAYDSNRSLNAARLWWVLSYYGHANVKVLDGGWRKWCAEGRPIEVMAPTAPSGSAFFTPQIQRSLLSTTDDLKAAYAQSTVAVWDIRSRDEYTGAGGRGNMRRGHVPGSYHLEWTALVNESDHTFKGAGEIQELLQGIGVTPNKTVHVY